MATGPTKKLMVWLVGVNSPPLTPQGRREAGYYLNLLQEGLMLTPPIAEPMPIIGPRVFELRLSDRAGDWRVMYWIDPDAIVVVEVFKKTTRATPHAVIRLCRRRLTTLDAN